MLIQRALIVEDLDTVGYGILMMLKEEMGIKDVDYCQYTNEGYLKFKGAAMQGEPYDLVITDLSFKEDYRDTSIGSGKDLIGKIREQGYNTPIIICSVEEKPLKIKHFLKKNQISAYVLKGRNGLKDLREAIENVKQGKEFVSPSLKPGLNGSTDFEIGDYDIFLLKHLSYGLSQNQISDLFTSKKIAPSSISSIEKRLNRLKDILKANNNVQLVANAKDLGLI